MKRGLHIVIVMTIAALCFSQTSVAIGGRSAPIEKETVSKIAKSYWEHLDKLTPGNPLGDSHNKKNSAKASEKAFAEFGYSFSATLNSIANQGFGYKNEQEYTNNIETVQLFLQTFLYYGMSHEFFRETYSENDAMNILKIIYWMMSDDTSLFFKENSQAPLGSFQENSEFHVNFFDKNELDRHIRKKWSRLQNALANDDIEEAASFFTLEKRETYRKILKSSKEVRDSIMNLKLIGLVEYDITEVSYVADSDVSVEVDGEMINLSTYIKYILDYGGQWNINFL